jgi:hypothetical protein
MSRLLAYYDDLRFELAGLKQALLYLESHACVPRTSPPWYAMWDDERFDPAPLTLWRTAIEQMETGNADAMLPGERDAASSAR